MSKTILVVAPHYDDVEFGLGAYLARLKRQGGTRVIVLYMFCGNIYPLSSGITRFSRWNDAQNAAEHLNYEAFPAVSECENAPEKADYVELVRHVEAALDEYNPDQVFIPLPSFNQDHRLCFDVCMTALRPVRRHFPTVLAYEYPMTPWGPGEAEAAKYGKVYARCDRLDLWDKVSALEMHVSQIKDGLAGKEGVEALARMRGLECGAEYAELFYMVRGIL